MDKFDMCVMHVATLSYQQSASTETTELAIPAIPFDYFTFTSYANALNDWPV